MYKIITSLSFFLIFAHSPINYAGVVSFSTSQECTIYCSNGVCDKDAEGVYKCNIVK